MKRPFGCEGHAVGSTLRKEHIKARKACRERSWEMVCTDPVLYAARLLYGAEFWTASDVADAFGADYDDVTPQLRPHQRWVLP